MGKSLNSLYNKLNRLQAKILDDYLIQILTSHGVLKVYLTKIENVENDGTLESELQPNDVIDCMVQTTSILYAVECSTVH